MKSEIQIREQLSKCEARLDELQNERAVFMKYERVRTQIHGVPTGLNELIKEYEGRVMLLRWVLS